MGKIKLLKGNNSISIDRITINENFEHIHEDIDTVKSTISNKNVETVSGKVDNESTVPGTTITQALESLKDSVDNTVLIPGATGPQGATGIGATGAQGATGISGATGAQGATGTILDTQTKFLIVDPINGNNATAVRGSYIKPFASVGGTNGAESIGASGDVIKIISDIEECGLGKNDLVYVFDKGVKIYWPYTNATPAGLSSGHLWTDSGKGNIKFTVYGGIHESSGYWYGNFDRGVVRLNNSSDVRIYDADRVSIEKDDGDIIQVNGATGANVEIYSNGEIYSEYRLFQIVNSSDTNIVLKAAGRITYKERGLQQIGNGASKALVHSDSEIYFEGHYVSVLRGDIYPNNTNNERSHWTVQAPRILRYELYPQNASNNGGFIFTWSNADVIINVNADVIQMKNVDPTTYPREHVLLAINQTNGGSDVHVNFNVDRIILGKSHGLENSDYGVNRDNSYVQFNNTDIVFLTDVVNLDNCINGSKVKYAFTGTCKIVLNPTAITAGQKAIGGVTGDSAYILGNVITNGDIFDNTFFDILTGNSYATGIPSLYINNTTLIDFNKYNGLI